MSDLQPSLVPDVLDRLVELGQATVTDGFVVFDGPSLNMDDSSKYLLIGWTNRPDARGTEVEMRDGGAGGRQAEVIDVHGSVWVALGYDGTQSAARREAYAVLDDFGAAIKTPAGQDSPLGKRVSRARLTSHAVEPLTGDGGGCAVPFTIHIEGTR